MKDLRMIENSKKAKLSEQSSPFIDFNDCAKDCYTKTFFSQERQHGWVVKGMECEWGWEEGGSNQALGGVWIKTKIIVWRIFDSKFWDFTIMNFRES